MSAPIFVGASEVPVINVLFSVSGTPINSIGGATPDLIAVDPGILKQGSRSFIGAMGAENVVIVDYTLNSLASPITYVGSDRIRVIKVLFTGSPLFILNGIPPDFVQIGAADVGKGQSTFLGPFEIQNAVINNLFTGTGAASSATGVGGSVTLIPVNTILPVITGATQVGQALTCSTGMWTNAPVSYAYLWNGQGNVTGQTYVSVSGDIGSTLHCRVTATTASGGTGVATSADTSTFVIDKPAAPTITSVTPGSGQNTIALTDASNNGSAITSHNLYRSTASGFTPAAGNLVSNFSGSGPYADTGLTNGTAYFYVLTAVNGAGEGAQSLQQSGTPISAATSSGAMDFSNSNNSGLIAALAA